MRIRLKILLLLFIIKSPLVFAQFEDLAFLEDIGEGRTDTADEFESDLDKEIEEMDSKSSSKEDDFIDDQYSYTGGKDFKNPPKRKFSNQALSHFGYNYFVNQPSTFAPLQNVPIPPDYIIGPDDNIKIILFGNTNKKYELQVTREGDIFIPEIGPLSVAGITFQDLQDLIKVNINNQFIGTQASITLGSLRSINIFVLGAANKPGMYSISALSTLINAIITTGGIDISGSLRDIKLKRNGEVISTFDFYELLLNGDTSGDSRLMQGDVIFIETIGKTAAINGEVNRSAIYELKDNESLSDLIKYAGNIKPKANLSSAEIIRINYATNSFNLLPVDLASIDSENFLLQNGDVLTIYPVVDNLKNAVLVSGHAQQPGFYAWNEGMRIEDLFDDVDDLLEMTDLNYVLIKRKDIKSQSFNFLQVDLEKLFNNSDSEENIFLFEEDEIIFLPSILSANLITTKLIQDKYIFDQENNKMVLEDEWTSLTYLRKSLSEKPIESRMPEPRDIEGEGMTYGDRYYEYNIYDYCVIPETLASTIPERLDEIELTNEITTMCRHQLLDPVLDLIRRNNTEDRLNMVSVFGNVFFPGSYPLTKDMMLSDAIKAAGGQKDRTYFAEVELNRRNKLGKRFSTSNTISDIEEAKEINLQSMDVINLKQVASTLKTVEIRGEVFFPGLYPISQYQTLGQVLKRAGGLTENGSAEAAFFQRLSLKEAEAQRIQVAQDALKRKIILSSTAGSEALGEDALEASAVDELTELIASDEIELELLGRLVIDLQGIINGDIEDIILDDGDVINIPKKRQSVSVIGEVFVANNHLYDEYLSIDDYISLSGGTTTYADTNNIYVIKSDGSIISPNQLSSGFFRGKNNNIKAGDTVVVPLEIDSFSNVRAANEITQIIYQMAVAAAAVNSF